MATHIPLAVCVTALQNAAMSQKRVAHAQYAVNLTIYMNAGGPTKEAQANILSAYARSGMDCADSNGREYKTVRRKISATTALFKKLTLVQIVEWVGEHRGTRAIGEIATALSGLGLDSTEKILAFSGAAPSVRAKLEPILHDQPAPTVRRQAFLFSQNESHIHIEVEPEATVDDLQKLIAKLTAMVQAKLENLPAAPELIAA